MTENLIFWWILTDKLSSRRYCGTLRWFLQNLINTKVVIGIPISLNVQKQSIEPVLWTQFLFINQGKMKNFSILRIQLKNLSNTIPSPRKTVLKTVFRIFICYFNVLIFDPKILTKLWEGDQNYLSRLIRVVIFDLQYDTVTIVIVLMIWDMVNMVVGGWR